MIALLQTWRNLGGASNRQCGVYIDWTKKSEDMHLIDYVMQV